MPVPPRPPFPSRGTPNRAPRFSAPPALPDWGADQEDPEEDSGDYLTTPLTELPASPELDGEGGYTEIEGEQALHVAGRSSSPRLFVAGAGHPTVTQLKVYRIESGVPVSLGTIDAEASEADLIQRFFSSMPRPGEGRMQFRFRPIDADNREMGHESSTWISEDHADLQRIRRVRELARAQELMGVPAQNEPAGPSGGFDPLGFFARSLADERDHSRRTLERLGDERLTLAQSMTANVHSITERMLSVAAQQSAAAMEAENNRNRHASDSMAAFFQSQLELITGQRSAEREMEQQRWEREQSEMQRRAERERVEAERAAERERAWSERQIKETEIRAQTLVKEHEARNQALAKETELRATALVKDAERIESRAEREAKERQAADQREYERRMLMWQEERRLEREAAERREREQREAMERREKEQERIRALEREAAERREREHREALERREQERQAALALEREERERRDRERDREREAERQRDREERERRESELKREHEWKMKQLEIEAQQRKDHDAQMAQLQNYQMQAAFAAAQGAKTDIKGLLAEATTFLTAVGIEPKDLVQRFLNPPAPEPPDNTSAWADLAGKVIGSVGEVAKAKMIADAAKQRRGRQRMMAPQNVPALPMYPNQPPMIPGRPPMPGQMRPAMPQPIPQFVASPAQPQQAPVQARPAAPPVPAGSPDAPKPAVAIDLPFATQRAGRAGVRSLLQQLRTAPADKWEALTTLALMQNNAIFEYIQAVSLVRAMEEAEAPEEITDKLIEILAAHPLVPDNFNFGLNMDGDDDEGDDESDDEGDDDESEDAEDGEEDEND